MPIARWQIERVGFVPDRVRLLAAEDVVAQGWWAVVTVVTALAIGSGVAVALDFVHGRGWSHTAWRNSVRLVGTLAAMWAVWIASALAAVGAPLF